MNEMIELCEKFEQYKQYKDLRALLNKKSVQDNWWKLVIPNAYDHYISGKDSRKRFIEWLDNEVKILGKEIGLEGEEE